MDPATWICGILADQFAESQQRQKEKERLEKGMGKLQDEIDKLRDEVNRLRGNCSVVKVRTLLSRHITL